MSDPLEHVLSLSDKRSERFGVQWDQSRKPPKPTLPGLPAADDLMGQCGWLTAVFHLDDKHPITSGAHSGLAGGRGHVALNRLAAPSLRFKPAARISNGQHLSDDLVWQLIPEDGEPYPWTNHQATKIARVVRWMCDASAAITSEQETARILTTYIEASAEVEGKTYGTTGERYDAAVALRPELDNWGKTKTRRYLIDRTKDEIAIRVSDLAHVAREVLGSSIAHGWLDAQMEEFGWQRVELQGQSISGRQGRVQGAHASADVYRGPVSSVYNDEKSVNT